MEEVINPEITNPDSVKLPKEVAHIEIDPNAKRPRKIHFLKIIIYTLIFIVIAALLAYVLILLRDRDKFQKLSKDVTSEVQSKLKAYPAPLPNACGEEIKLCPDGTVVEKSGLECQFPTCSDSSNDITKFWKVTNSEDKYIRIYDNLDLGYNFKLVKTWDFKGLDYGFILYSPNYNCDEVIVSDTTSCNGTIIEMVTSNTTGKSDVEEWYNSSANYFKINSDVKWPDSYKVIDIAGVKAIEVQNALNNISYFFIYDNTVYALKSVSADEIDYKNSMPTLKNIISTLVFIDSSKN